MKPESSGELDCDLTWLKSTSLCPVAPCAAQYSCRGLVEGFLQVVSFSLWTLIQGTSSHWAVSHSNLFLNRHLNRESQAIWKAILVCTDAA